MTDPEQMNQFIDDLADTPKDELEQRVCDLTDKVRELEEEIAWLAEALVDHNERLRSAQSIAFRDGKDTNWQSFRGECTYTLAEHHEIVNNCRALLNKEPKQ